MLHIASHLCITFTNCSIFFSSYCFLSIELPTLYLSSSLSLFLLGAESISVYEDVLRSVRYRLAKGSARFERRFRLSCSEMNGRYTSNELTLEVTHLIDNGGCN